MQRKIETLEAAAAAAAAAAPGRLQTLNQTLMSGAVWGNRTHDTTAWRKENFLVQRGVDPGVAQAQTLVRGPVAARTKHSPSPQKEVSMVRTARPRDSRREGPKAEVRRPSNVSRGARSQKRFSDYPKSDSPVIHPRTLVIIMGLQRGNIGVSPFAVCSLYKWPDLCE